MEYFFLCGNNDYFIQYKMSSLNVDLMHHGPLIFHILASLCCCRNVHVRKNIIKIEIN
jgi:hypothetical protein